MQDIIDGFLKFRREAFPQRTALYKQLATSQHPRTLFISCSDSRLVPELVMQQEPGDMFVISQRGQHRAVLRPGTGRRVGDDRVRSRSTRRR